MDFCSLTGFFSNRGRQEGFGSIFLLQNFVHKLALYKLGLHGFLFIDWVLFKGGQSENKGRKLAQNFFLRFLLGASL